MNKTHIKIETGSTVIPAVWWGDEREKVIIATHGNMSNKEDLDITALAEVAVSKGYGVLSYDQPQHGNRRGDSYLCIPHHCKNDLLAVYEHAKAQSEKISMFSVSMGAFYTMLAYPDLKGVERIMFLAPILNAIRMVEGLQAVLGISDEYLNQVGTIYLTDEQRHKVGEIPLPKGQTVDWDYKQYVLRHAVDSLEPHCGIDIVYGVHDAMSKSGEAEEFVTRYGGTVSYLDDCEHYFHDREQLQKMSEWLREKLELLG